MTDIVDRAKQARADWDQAPVGDWFSSRRLAALIPALVAEIQRLRGQVARVRELAEDLGPKLGEPCDDPEPCCGSAANCDALQPSVTVEGREAILRALGGDA